MTEAAASGPAPDGGRPGPAAVDSAERALNAAREAVGALVTVRAKALQEGTRLRARAEAPGRSDLLEDAALQERRAAALEPRIEQLRDLARRAEVAWEALRSDRGAGPSSPDAGSGTGSAGQDPSTGGPDAPEAPDAPADGPTEQDG